MSEVELRDNKGRVWTADTFALERGYLLDAAAFAEFLLNEFHVHGYERMQQLWRIRDTSIRRNPSGSFPEGADIGELFK